MGDGRVDRILRHIALHTMVIRSGTLILFQRSPLQLHFMSSLPGSGDYLADPSHGLGV